MLYISSVAGALRYRTGCENAAAESAAALV